MKPNSFKSMQTEDLFFDVNENDFANKVIEIVSKKKFLDDLNQKATFFLNKLEKVKNTYNHLIEEIRGKGFLLGIKSNINNSILFIYHSKYYKCA